MVVEQPSISLLELGSPNEIPDFEISLRETKVSALGGYRELHENETLPALVVEAEVSDSISKEMPPAAQMQP
jgi:hypothetical protein